VGAPSTATSSSLSTVTSASASASAAAAPRAGPPTLIASSLSLLGGHAKVSRTFHPYTAKVAYNTFPRTPGVVTSKRRATRRGAPSAARYKARCDSRNATRTAASCAPATRFGVARAPLSPRSAASSLPFAAGASGGR
jgi:hypothetical protein